MDDALTLRLGLALAIGLIVGLERGWRERTAAAGSRTAGVRTYGLAGLLGGLVAALAVGLDSPALFGLGFATFATVFAWFKAREALHDRDFSVTGVVAALAVFALGALAVQGDPRVAAAGGVATAGLLASREVLHALLRRLSWADVRSTLLLLAMTAIVLPLLPDRAVDPWGMVNPRQVWLLTVLAAAISFAGYVGVRLAGPARGMVVSSLAGAVASSTAVTLALARRAAGGGTDAALLAGAAALAGMVSLLRVLLLVVVVGPALAGLLAAPALAAALAFGALGALLVRRQPPAPDAAETQTAALGNPFDLAPLLVFAGLFAVLAAFCGWLATRLGSTGILVTAALLGLADVDVVTLSVLRLAATGAIDPSGAAQAILLSLGVNALARASYASVAGPRGFAWPLAVVTAAALAVGGSVALATLPIKVGLGLASACWPTSPPAPTG
jgi:uncharacterized membrane protein (DUF4010 family)